jgi:hypothetical protein
VSDHTTPADELRAAARTLRALLADPELTPDPWLSMDRGDRVLWDGEGAEDQPPVYVIDEPMSNGANADYIAVMHPGVGLAVADWLEAEARRLTATAHPGWQEHVAPHALAVARAVLGHPTPATKEQQ